MRAVIGLLTVGCILTSYVAPARAIGCISGGVAGAVAGHMMHHGVLGAIGGCVAGHEYHKHHRRDSMQNSNYNNGGYENGRQGSGAYPNQE
ncbi:MAG TPA: hypothetical protein VHO91_00460 [Rhodopila sp.]|nr:hypothetical protein [Rhodopila sp.]